MTLKHLAIIFAVVFLLAGNTFAGKLSKVLYFSAPEIVRVPNGAVLRMDRCENMSEPGKPLIPVYKACFMLQPKETFSKVTVESGKYIKLSGSYQIIPAPAQTPIGFNLQKDTERDENVYRLKTFYPEEKGVFVTEQVVSGIHLVFVNIYPCRIVPSEGTVMYTNSVNVILETKSINAPQPEHPGRAVRSAREKIYRLIDNKEDASIGSEKEIVQSDNQYQSQSIYSYIIITSADLSDYFQPLADLKTDSGLKSKIVTLEWIQSSFSGFDIQQQIRNFISYAYFNWSTEYVLLGGDDDIIPHRGLYVNAGTEIEPDIASDLYFAALDGNWNSDGDQYYGEPGEEDLIPEVSLGRLPVNNNTEIDNFTAKLTAYSLQPQPGQCVKSLMLGELLWSEYGIDTWGGDYKDEILNGSNNYNLVTAGPNQYFINGTLYDRNLPSPWNETDLIPLINNGVNLVNHLGHTGLHNAMHFTNNTLPLLENDGTDAIPSIIYSQGCYSASFDNRDYTGATYSEDAIGEQFVTAPAGAVAYIGNTRFGWNAPGSTCGVSQFFDRQFFDALFGESIGTIGHAFDDSRIDNISYTSYPLFRYVMYEMCLLGDPSMMVWTSEPSELTVIHNSSIPFGNNDLIIETTSGGNPVSGALISIFNTNSSTYQTALTNDEGLAALSPELSDTGVVHLRVNARNHYLYRDSILVDQTPDTLAELEDIQIDDDSLGQSRGDGDGIVESGEKIEIGIVVSNQGSSTIDNCSVSLTCDNPYISIIDSLSDTFSLPARTSIIQEKEFIVEILPSIPGGCDLKLTFQINTADKKWYSHRHLTVNAPVIELDSWTTCDSLLGNGNGCVEAWEFVNITTSWSNNGTIDIPTPTLTLSMPDQEFARPYKSFEVLPSIPVGSTVVSHNNLSFYVKAKSPPFSRFPIILNLEKENLVSHSETLIVTSCGYSIDDPADSVNFWNHSAIVGVDGWHISDDQYYSSSKSWKCGGNTAENYPNMMEAVLVSPPVCLDGNSTLSFWHKIDAEAGSAYPYWAEDAGVVEITTDGGKSWAIINPTYNYPCRASGSNTIFLNPYQKCYSGQSSWKFEEFDISAFKGQAMIRFHFASNEQYGFEGWYIDDINITTEKYTDIKDEDNPSAGFANNLRLAYPNPFNPTTVIPFEVAKKSHVTLKIYDVSGRLVQTLIDDILIEGRHSATWNAKDKTGRDAASNVYFCRLKIGSFTSTERLILLR